MIAGIIPARYAASRFPGKPLADIAGKTMVQRVWEQAQKSKSLDKVVVATDDARIFDHVVSFGGEAIMTATDHPSGTDRCMEALQKLGGGYDYVINIQGDEPFIQPEQIDELAAVLDGKVQLATLVTNVESEALLFSEGEAKVVLNHKNEALYFSRSVIPAIKGKPSGQWLERFPYVRHVGMYAYRTDTLAAITKLPVGRLEAAEGLEQLRWLEAGYPVQCAFTRFESYCIDEPDDIARVLGLISGRMEGRDH